MERAIAAAERRAYLLPGCRYIILSSAVTVRVSVVGADTPPTPLGGHAMHYKDQLSPVDEC